MAQIKYELNLNSSGKVKKLLVVLQMVK